MLLFLRKIRKALIGTNSATKYLLYAIGEIALVVIGILFALQINNWNQERINNKTESAILTRIIQDLKTDLNEIKISDESNEVRLLRGVWAIEKLGKDMDKIKSGWVSFEIAQRNHKGLDSLFDIPFGRTLMRIRFYYVFEENKITLEEIMSTGKLDIIRDKKIKTVIQNHYAKLKELTYLQRLLDKNRDDLVDYLLEYNISQLNELSLEEIQLRIGEPDNLIARLENFIEVTRVCYRGISLEEDSIKNRTQRLINLIEAYLEN